jgi:hypothetical protein
MSETTKGGSRVAADPIVRATDARRAIALAHTMLLDEQSPGGVGPNHREAFAGRVALLSELCTSGGINMHDLDRWKKEFGAPKGQGGNGEGAKPKKSHKSKAQQAAKAQQTAGAF